MTGKELGKGIDFDDKEFYSKLGYKCGLEIHQQLDTKKKLFCHCPVGYRNDEPDGMILRHMRPTLSEMGTYDGTALMEFKTKKQVVYQLYRENMCTYEMDDTPPFPVNQTALDYAIEIALMLGCKLVDEVHVTRKQYLDGSIPTGFQRTAIIGVDGWIPYRGRRIRIQQLALEEDACREVEDKGHRIVFRTDRLSIPLVEIVTKPDMLTPHEAAEVDGILGRLLRASARVRRGIGSARQDVNISINGVERMEIKGVPKTEYIKTLTHYEALRQRSLLELRKELNEEGITEDSLNAEFHDVTGLVSEVSNPRLRKVTVEGGRVNAVKLCGWRKFIRWQTQPGLTFADELRGRVRVIACLDEMPNMFVLDGEGEGLGPEEEGMLRDKLGAEDEDVVVLVWGPEEDAETGAKEIIIRAKEATEKIPQETRQRRRDSCRTGFERILPGPDRMYPDTDLAPLAIDKKKIERIRAGLPLPPWEREERYEEMGIPEHVCMELSIHHHARLFERLVEETRMEPRAIAEALVEWEKAIRREAERVGLEVRVPEDEELARFFKKAGERNTPRRGLYHAFERLLYGEGIMPPSPLPEDELAELCRKVAGENRDVTYKSPDLKLDFLLGEVIERSGGRAEPDKTRSMLELS